MTMAVVSCAATKIADDSDRLYVTRQGLRVEDTSARPIGQARVEELIDQLVAAMGGPSTIVRPIHKWLMRIIPQYILVTYQEGEDKYLIVAEGYTVPQDRLILVSNVYECPVEAAVMHELVHALWGISHTEAEYWDLYDKFEALVANNLCPKWIGKDWKIGTRTLPIPSVKDLMEGPMPDMDRR